MPRWAYKRGGLYPGGLISGGFISRWAYKRGVYIQVGL